MKRVSSSLCNSILIISLFFSVHGLQSNDDWINKDHALVAIVIAGCACVVYYDIQKGLNAHAMKDDSHSAIGKHRSAPSVSEWVMNGLSDTLGVDLVDYRNDLKKHHQDENGDTALHHLAKKSISWTAEEYNEQAPDILITFYKQLWQDDSLRDRDATNILRGIEDEYRGGNRRKYLQFLLLINNEGKTAKDILVEGSSEGSKLLLNSLEAAKKEMRR